MHEDIPPRPTYFPKLTDQSDELTQYLDVVSYYARELRREAQQLRREGRQQDIRSLGGVAKNILEYFVEIAGPDTHSLAISIDDIGFAVFHSRSAVKTALAQLQASGFVEVSQESTAVSLQGRGRPRVGALRQSYRLKMPASILASYKAAIENGEWDRPRLPSDQPDALAELCDFLGYQK